jgi:hypothetical protein
MGRPAQPELPGAPAVGPFSIPVNRRWRPLAAARGSDRQAPVSIVRLRPVLFLLAALAVLGPAAAQPKGSPFYWYSSDGPAPPLHPTAILSSYRGRDKPVVDVSGETAEVEDGGVTVRLPQKATYDPVRVSQFGPGWIEVRVDTAESGEVRQKWLLNGSEIDGGVFSASSTFACRVKSQQACTDCYLAIIYFRHAYLNGDEDSGALVAFQKIGPLAAGVETRVRAVFGYIKNPEQYAYLPLFFSRGWEIRSNYSELSAVVFHRSEMLRHQRLLDAYLQKHVRDTLPPKAYARFPPSFGPDVDRTRIPATARVDYGVTAGGTVDGIEVSAPLDPNALAAIQRALGGWLYMPRLENGVAVGTAVSTQLEFNLAPAPAR